jgi:hypothetical protein
MGSEPLKSQKALFLAELKILICEWKHLHTDTAGK